MEEASEHSEVETLLLQETQARLANGENASSLLFATVTKQGAFKSVRFLLEHGADVNHTLQRGDLRGYILRAFVDIQARLELIRLLLEYGAKVDALAMHCIGFLVRQRTAAYMACKAEEFNDDPKMTLFFSKATTVLHIACYGGGLEVVKLLLENGLDANYALREACQCGNETIVGFLLLQYDGQKTDVNATDDEGWTPLLEASSGGFDAKASTGGFDEIIKLLLKHGARADAAQKDGLTALHLVCYHLEHFSFQTADILLQHGADINAMDHEGCTPLYSCSAKIHFFDNESSAVVEFLLQNGASFHAAKANGTTPLHEVCNNGKANLAEMFAQCGADVNAIDIYGYAPLHRACMGLANSHGQKAAAYSSTIKTLLENGANINITDKNETTPLFLVCKYGSRQLIDLILEKGANLTAGSVSPVYGAIEKGNYVVAEYLVQKGASLDQQGDMNTLITIFLNRHNFDGAMRFLKRTPPIQGRLALLLGDGITWNENLTLLVSQVKELQLGCDWVNSLAVAACLQSLVKNRSLHHLHLKLNFNFHVLPVDLYPVCLALGSLFRSNNQIQEMTVGRDVEEMHHQEMRHLLQEIELLGSVESAPILDGMMNSIFQNSNLLKLSVHWATHLWLIPLAQYLCEPTCVLTEIDLLEHQYLLKGSTSHLIHQGLIALCGSLTANRTLCKMTVSNAMLSTRPCTLAEEAAMAAPNRTEGTTEWIAQGDIDCMLLQKKIMPLGVAGQEALWAPVLHCIWPTNDDVP